MKPEGVPVWREARLSFRQTHVLLRTPQELPPLKDLEDVLLKTYGALEGMTRDLPGFLTSLHPLPPMGPKPIRAMMQAARDAGVGPMAGVAGLVAAELLRVGLRSGCRDLVVENGGDLDVHREHPGVVTVFPGWEGFDTPLGILLPAGTWGVASSSGRMGPSLSQGVAQLVTVVDVDPVRADVWATAMANRIGQGQSPEQVLGGVKRPPSALMVVDRDQVWYQGPFELRPSTASDWGTSRGTLSVRKNGKG